MNPLRALRGNYFWGSVSIVFSDGTLLVFLCETHTCVRSCVHACACVCVLLSCCYATWISFDVIPVDIYLCIMTVTQKKRGLINHGAYDTLWVHVNNKHQPFTPTDRRWRLWPIVVKIPNTKYLISLYYTFILPSITKWWIVCQIEKGEK